MRTFEANQNAGGDGEPSPRVCGREVAKRVLSRRGVAVVRILRHNGPDRHTSGDRANGVQGTRPRAISSNLSLHSPHEKTPPMVRDCETPATFLRHCSPGLTAVARRARHLSPHPHQALASHLRMELLSPTGRSLACARNAWPTVPAPTLHSAPSAPSHQTTRPLNPFPTCNSLPPFHSHFPPHRNVRTCKSCAGASSGAVT